MPLAVWSSEPAKNLRCKRCEQVKEDVMVVQLNIDPQSGAAWCPDCFRTRFKFGVVAVGEKSRQMGYTEAVIKQMLGESR